LLLEGDAAAEECDVVIGRKQGDQAENEAADGLN
jgi:hypothetical protein